jgi:hypothetical protein
MLLPHRRRWTGLGPSCSARWTTREAWAGSRIPASPGEPRFSETGRKAAARSERTASRRSTSTARATTPTASWRSCGRRSATRGCHGSSQAGCRPLPGWAVAAGFETTSRNCPLPDVLRVPAVTDVSGFRSIGPAAVLEIAPGPGLTLVVGRNGSGTKKEPNLHGPWWGANLMFYLQLPALIQVIGNESTVSASGRRVLPAGITPLLIAWSTAMWIACR